jgi:hypothetical protein
MNKSS